MIKKNQTKDTKTLRYDTNPFLSSIKIKTKRIGSGKGDMLLIKEDSKELISHVAGFWEEQEVDNEKFVKLFVNGVKALAELTSSGTKLFEILYYEIQSQPQKDSVFFGYNPLDKKHTSISRATYSRGLRELVEKNFIAPSVKGTGWYWINPDYIWNGDRLVFAKAYRKQSSKGINLVVQTTDD